MRERFKFDRTGDDVWVKLDCGHFVREVEGKEDDDYPCGSCNNEPKPTASSLRKERTESLRQEREKKRKHKDGVKRRLLDRREKIEVEKALQARIAANSPKPKGFWWRGKFRITG